MSVRSLVTQWFGSLEITPFRRAPRYRGALSFVEEETLMKKSICLVMFCVIVCMCVSTVIAGITAFAADGVTKNGEMAVSALFVPAQDIL